MRPGVETIPDASASILRRRRLALRDRLRTARTFARALGLAWLLVPFLLYHAQAARLSMPGLLDPLYYLHVAESLGEGRGFEVAYLWNHGERPEALVHPANAYWGPATSLLLATGPAVPASRPAPSKLLILLIVAGFLATAAELRLIAPGSRLRVTAGSQASARELRFHLCLLGAPVAVLMAVTILSGPSAPLEPHVEAMLMASGVAIHVAHLVALRVFRDPRVALLAPVFLATSYPFTYFSITTDSPVPFAVAANLALLMTGLLVRAPAVGPAFAAGLCCAAATLTRAEGIFVALLPLWYLGVRPLSRRSMSLRPLAAFAAGFAALMAPWWLRNALAFGTPFPASIAKAVTMLDYNELFLWFPPPPPDADGLRLAASLAGEKLSALASNAQTLVMGDLALLMLLAPFGLATAWCSAAGRPFVLFVAMQFAVLSLCFSFQAKNGTFLHSMIAFLPFLLASGTAGLLRAALLLQQIGKGRRAGRAWTVAGRALVPCVLVLVAGGWWRSTAGDSQLPRLLDHTASTFRRLGGWVDANLPPGAPLMTNLPFETYHFVRRPCAILPRDRDPAAIARAAARYGIRHLVVLSHPKYLVRPFEGDTIPLGDEGELSLIESVPVDPGPAGFREIRIYAIELESW